LGPFQKTLHPTWGAKLVTGLLTCAAVILSLFQENNLSKSIPNRVKSRTEAVKHLSRSLETLKMLKIILSKFKFIN